MTDLPSHVDIHEEGPREGFQIEPGPIGTADKIRLIEALAETGLAHIQVCSFVNPRLVPGWADAEAVVEGFKAKPGRRLHRAVVQRRRAGAGARLQGQARRSPARSRSPPPKPSRARTSTAAMPRTSRRCASRPPCTFRSGVPVTRIGVMAAFGCNYQGDISPGAGGPHARGRLGDRRRGRHRDHAVLAGRHHGLGHAGAHRARARRGARALAGDAALAASARHARPRRGQRACRRCAWA